MKVFVTGHKGFIGSHLTPHLDDWVGYDGDILDREELSKAMKGCGAVIHLAGKFGKVNEDLEIYKVNTIGTAMVVQAMHENDIKRIIFASSCGAEERFINAYDDSKHLAEKVLQDAGLSFSVLRLSNLYGRGQDDKLVANMIKGFKTGEVTVYGDGKQTRDLIHINDAVRAIVASLETGHQGFVEIGYGVSYSILDLVDLLSEITGKTVKINFKENTKDFKISEINTNLARAVLGFSAEVDLKTGLEITL